MNPVFSGKIGMLVNINQFNVHFAPHFRLNFFEDWLLHLAGATPGGTEIK
jgi:hypothetical protein